MHHLMLDEGVVDLDMLILLAEGVCLQQVPADASLVTEEDSSKIACHHLLNSLLQLVEINRLRLFVLLTLEFEAIYYLLPYCPLLELLAQDVSS